LAGSPTAGIAVVGGVLALSPQKTADYEQAVDALFMLMQKGVRAGDILSKEAFENAVSVCNVPSIHEHTLPWYS
jgi:dihydroxyacid dehydratase/phosphogluconate dehydratase